ncbi:TlpA family protein disulfide reductase [Lutibacter sp.]
MKKIFNKKNLSNLLFIIAIGLLLYPPTREWGMRQIAFAPSVKNSDTIENLASYNWELKGLNTRSVNFNEFEDKVIFVNFWATWCPPCRAELPMIQKLYNDYKDKVAFVFVTNEDWNTVNKFFIEKDYDLPVYNSTSTPPQKFLETNSIPASYLIDKDGAILISKVGAANWNSKKVRTLLDSLILK